MKVAQTIPSPYFFTTTVATRSRRADRPVIVESNDDLGRKQEIVCGAILGLSLVSSVVVCFWQLASH